MNRFASISLVQYPVLKVLSTNAFVVSARRYSRELREVSQVPFFGNFEKFLKGYVCRAYLHSPSLCVLLEDAKRYFTVLYTSTQELRVSFPKL